MVLENKHAEYVDDNPEYNNLPIHMLGPTHHVFLQNHLLPHIPHPHPHVRIVLGNLNNYHRLHIHSSWYTIKHLLYNYIFCCMLLRLSSSCSQWIALASRDHVHDFPPIVCNVHRRWVWFVRSLPKQHLQMGSLDMKSHVALCW